MTQFGSLENQIVVVTGSSSGIGRAMALEFAEAGADVVLHCRQSLDACREVAAEVQSHGRRAEIVQGDIRDDAESLTKLVDDAWGCFGRVDVWVNNAGVDLLTGDQAKLGFAHKLAQLLDGDVSAFKS